MVKSTEQWRKIIRIVLDVRIRGGHTTHGEGGEGGGVLGVGLYLS
jgi:hypothetical protein